MAVNNVPATVASPMGWDCAHCIIHSLPQLTVPAEMVCREQEYEGDARLQVVSEILSSCGDNLDAAIKRLGELRITANGGPASTSSVPPGKPELVGLWRILQCQSHLLSAYGWHSVPS